MNYSYDIWHWNNRLLLSGEGTGHVFTWYVTDQSNIKELFVVNFHNYQQMYIAQMKSNIIPYLKNNFLIVCQVMSPLDEQMFVKSM